MKESNDPKVQLFLQDIESVDADKYAIISAVREIVFTVYPEVGERIMYGGIMFSLQEDFGGVFASKKHVSVEFSNGVRLKDPDTVLEGSGKYRRHVKLHSVDDVLDKHLLNFIQQVAYL